MRGPKNKVFRTHVWRKVRYDFWIGDDACGMSAAELGLRVLFEVRAGVDEKQLIHGRRVLGVGWMLRDSGKPMSASKLSSMSRFPEAEVIKALNSLRDNELVVQSDQGAWGVPGWADRQDEDPFGNRRGLEPTSVYFIQSGVDGPIKIGVSADPVARMAQMQTGMPHTLRLLAFYPGTRDDEQNLHKRLATFRIRGEWFHPSEEVFAAVRARVFHR